MIPRQSNRVRGAQKCPKPEGARSARSKGQGRIGSDLWRERSCRGSLGQSRKTRAEPAGADMRRR